MEDLRRTNQELPGSPMKEEIEVVCTSVWRDPTKGYGETSVSRQWTDRNGRNRLPNVLVTGA